MKYYNPFFDELKDERLEIISDNTIRDTKYILAKLHPNLINTCPSCSSHDVIRYGK